MNLLSAITPPDAQRFRFLKDIPLVVNHAANAIVVLAGVSLILLSRQMMRGKKRAWILALVLTSVSLISHIFKAFDIEEALISGALMVILLLGRRQFRALGDPASFKRLAIVIPGLIFVDFAFGLGGLYLRHVAPAGADGLFRSVQEVAARLIGLEGDLNFSGRFGHWFPVSLTALGVLTIATIAWDIFRPVVARSTGPSEEADARRLVCDYGRGSLDYFLLRDDKQKFFDGDCVLGYRIVGGIAMASGDPVGPVEQWPQVISGFMAWAESHGWGIACIGTCEQAAEIWKSLDLKTIYIGEEAVIDLTEFNLEGRKIRKVRQAVAHIERKGYTAEWHRSGDLNPDLRLALMHLSNTWKAGDEERGFSMSLGRLFDPRDADCLVAIARDETGLAKGFLHFVPSSNTGFSLDVMRKDRATPSALNDYLITKTLLHLQASGYKEVSLNFAFLAELFDRPESVDTAWKRSKRWIALRLGPWFQIESLYRFNDKFIPRWRRRYIAFQDPLSVPAVALAALRAEKLLDFDIFRHGQGGKRLQPS